MEEAVGGFLGKGRYLGNSLGEEFPWNQILRQGGVLLGQECSEEGVAEWNSL